MLLAILLSDIWNADIWFPPSFLFSILLPRTETFEVLLLGHMLSRTLSIQDISYLRQKLSGTLATTIRDSRFFFQFLAFPFSIFYLFQTNTLWSNMFSRHLMSFFHFFRINTKRAVLKITSKVLLIYIWKFQISKRKRTLLYVLLQIEIVFQLL